MSRQSIGVPIENIQEGHSTVAYVPATATATADQVATGYIVTTSAAATTLTLPTGTLLGQRLGAKAGTVFNLFVDNTGGADVVTVAVATNGIQSNFDLEITAATASVTPAAITPLTIPSGATGLARYTIVFSSPTAYVFTRSA